MTKIIIIKLAALGDVLRTTCILPGLKEKYPDASVTWITSSSAINLLQNNALIDRLISFDEAKALNLHKEYYDLIVSLEDDLGPSRFAGQLRSKDFFGVYTDTNGTSYSENSAKWFDMSLVSVYGKIKADDLKKSNSMSYPDILFDGLKISHGLPSLYISPEDSRSADEFAHRYQLTDELKIGLNTGAGNRWQFKQLNISKTVELAEQLFRRTGAKILLFGGPDESDRNKQIIAKANCPIVDTGTRNHLGQFASLIGLSDILITSDSLALHIASAIGIPTVAFFGPTSAAEIRMFGSGEKIIAPMSCVCCYKQKCDIRPSCMDKISIERIVGTAFSILATCEKSQPSRSHCSDAH